MNENNERVSRDGKRILSDEEFEIMRHRGTERPFSGKYDAFFEDGLYCCADCGHILFESTHKFDAGCGWPSFDRTAHTNSVVTYEDTRYGLSRVEVACRHCGAHLGHVFPDGPTETTGMRYCINSASLSFDPKTPNA